MRKSVAAAGLALAIVSAAVLPGCVVAIGNESNDDWEGRKVNLSATERETLPVVTSHAELPTIGSRYETQLASLQPGMTVDEFRDKFPEAVFVERREQAGTIFDAYRVQIDEKYRRKGYSYGYVARDEAWFYFKDATFVKWGAENQWP